MRAEREGRPAHGGGHLEVHLLGGSQDWRGYLRRGVQVRRERAQDCAHGRRRAHQRRAPDGPGPDSRRGCHRQEAHQAATGLPGGGGCRVQGYDGREVRAPAALHGGFYQHRRGHRVPRPVRPAPSQRLEKV